MSADSEKVPPIYLFDKDIRKKYPVVAGLDEAGRGPLAGPVVAAAVILSPDAVIHGLRDSKKIPARTMKRIFWSITRYASKIGVGIVDAEVIDRINILQSTRLAMKHALADLETKPDMLLIDAVSIPDVLIPQRAIIRGESVSASIAAASVVAKVVRDELMNHYHAMFPDYNFKKHKGYSTKEHMERLNTCGPCPIHRKSFRKVMDMRLPLE